MDEYQKLAHKYPRVSYFLCVIVNVYFQVVEFIETSPHLVKIYLKTAHDTSFIRSGYLIIKSYEEAVLANSVAKLTRKKILLVTRCNYSFEHCTELIVKQL